MSLQEKVLRLKLEGALAVHHALWWEKQIALHGEEKATAFYTHLGLNHLEKKSVEFDGLTLRREPKEHEKLCVKGISQAQESSKEKIGTILLTLRSELISDGLKDIKKLEPATYHELTLSASSEIRESLRDRLVKTHKQGRLLVAAELGSKKSNPRWEMDYQEISESEAAILDEHYHAGRGKSIAIKQDDEDEFDELDTLTDLTDARVANDVQSRITAAAARFALLGLAGAALIDAIQKEMADGSVSYIDRAAGEAANKVVALGRYAEMRDRADSIERYEYSALLDSGTCEPCFADDGKEAASSDDLPEVPNVDCAGGSMCRCFVVAIAEGNM